MKKTNRMKIMNKKNKYFSLESCLIICLIILMPILIFSLTSPKKEEIQEDTISSIKGLDKMNAQTSLTSIIKKYLEETPKLKEYVEKNAVENITLKSMKEDFNVDTTDFENQKYGCSLEDTSINFNGSYDNQVILLACDVFLLD